MENYFSECSFVFVPKPLASILKQQPRFEDVGFMPFLKNVEDLEKMAEAELIAEMHHASVNHQHFMEPGGLVSTYHNESLNEMFIDLWGADKVDEVMANYNPFAKEKYREDSPPVEDGVIPEVKWEGVIRHETVETLEGLRNVMVIEYGYGYMEDMQLVGHNPRMMDLMKRIVYTCANDKRLVTVKKSAYWYLVKQTTA